VKRGWLIAFEGVDGSGKTTQVARLADALRARGLDVVTTREPTDGRYGQRIRAMATSGEPPPPHEELRWFIEDRRDHVKETIAPALERGAVVVTDRYFLSTVAYQGARGHEPAELLARSEAEFPLPDLVLLLEVPPTRGLERVRRRGASEPAFEQREYLEEVAAIFHSIERDYVARVEATGDVDAVHAGVWRIVAERLELPDGS
jgi:dTMP kinase